MNEPSRNSRHGLPEYGYEHWTLHVLQCRKEKAGHCEAHLVSSQSNSPGQSRRPVWSFPKPLSSFVLDLRGGSDGPYKSLTHVMMADLRLLASSPRAASDPMRSYKMILVRSFHPDIARTKYIHFCIVLPMIRSHPARPMSWPEGCA